MMRRPLVERAHADILDIETLDANSLYASPHVFLFTIAGPRRARTTQPATLSRDETLLPAQREWANRPHTR
jgi:hypothetical protein